MVERFVWQFFSYFGDIAYWLGFSIAFLLVYPLLEKRDKEKTRWILCQLIPVVLVSYLVVIGLKFLFLVPRPCLGFEPCPITPSFPSGHAAIAFAFATVVVTNLRRRVYLLFFCLAALVAFSRLMLGTHWVEDVIAGGALGIAIGCGGVIAKKVELTWFYRRKLVHLSAISILLVEHFFGKYFTLVAIASLSILYLVSELLRRKGLRFPLIQTITKACMEPKGARLLARIKDFFGITKRTFFATPLYFAAGIFTLLLLFPKQAFYFGVIAAVIGDGMAGIVGKKFGKRKIFYNRQKTLEGSLACFFSVLFPYLLLTNFPSALFLALFTILIESLFTRYENFILPVSVGIAALFI